MHGAAGWPAQQMNVSRWNRLADEQGFIVVYPAGSGVPKIWHVDRGAGLMRDVGFISALIDTLEAAYNIDPTRIYANGLSIGGGMAFVLSCTLSDRIAAVGMVAAAQSLPADWCQDQRPERPRSNQWSLRMSPVSNTRTVLPTRSWCSMPPKEEV